MHYLLYSCNHSVKFLSLSYLGGPSEPVQILDWPISESMFAQKKIPETQKLLKEPYESGITLPFNTLKIKT